MNEQTSAEGKGYIIAVVVAIIGLIGVIFLGFMTWRGPVDSAKVPIDATMTAESKGAEAIASTQTAESIEKMIQEGIAATQAASTPLAQMTSTEATSTATPDIEATQSYLSTQVTQSVQATMAVHLEDTKQAELAEQQTRESRPTTTPTEMPLTPTPTNTITPVATSTATKAPTSTSTATPRPTSTPTATRVQASSNFRFYDKNTGGTVDIGSSTWKENFSSDLHPGWILGERWTIVKDALTLTSLGDELKSSTLAYLPVLVGQDYEFSFDVEWENRESDIGFSFGEIRSSNHQYFENTQYIEEPTFVMVRSWVSSATYCDFDLKISKRDVDGFVDLDSSHERLRKCTIPEDIKFKLIVTGGHYQIQVDGENVTEFREVRNVDNSELKALFFQISISTDHKQYLGRMGIPFIDNIEIKLR
ncbi:MAG: hypothetical protein AAF702_01500 [Chloroflexota bacterium]